MRRILMIAFHFPPQAGSSGIQRTLRFVQQLPRYHWQPIVLTAQPRAYETRSDDLLREVPDTVPVARAFALDTQRHLAVAGRYPGFLARPDRWMAWYPGAVLSGLRLIRRYRPDVLWSTYPIATAHRIGHALHRLSAIPWVADFRDPMAQDDYPPDPRTHRVFSRIEAQVFGRAALCTVTTPGTARLYRARFPAAAARVQVLENGYDEESFATLAPGGAPLTPGKLTLLHSGVVYPSERDPRALLQALALIRTRSPDRYQLLRLRFRGSAHDDFLRDEIARHGVADAVELAPPMPYKAALAEMMRADGLMVMQAANCNEQIPAKLYEYLRAGRPILGLTDQAGDTWSALQAAGITSLAPLDDAVRIAACLEAFVDAIRDSSASLPSQASVSQSSRQTRTQELVRMLDAVVSGAASSAGGKPGPSRASKTRR